MKSKEDSIEHSISCEVETVEMVEQLYRVDFTGHAENGIKNVWCIIKKSKLQDGCSLNNPFLNGGNHGAVFISSHDDRLSDDFDYAMSLIETFSNSYEDKSQEFLYRVWNSKPDNYWVATFPLIYNDSIIIGQPYVSAHGGGSVFVNNYKSSMAFKVGKRLIDQYMRFVDYET